MSWTEKIQNKINIVTGDGKSYDPLYIITEKSVEYHIAEFDFVNIEGTLVKRSKPRGRRHNIELYFQGENHLDESEAFENSAKDPRPWTILHPYYGQLLVQPTGLTFDPTGLNVSKITGELIETISEDYPRIGISPSDQAKKNVSDYQDANIEMFVNTIEPTAAIISDLKSDVNSVYSIGSASVDFGDLSNDYFQLFNNTLSAINNMAADASLAATYLTDVIMYPYRFEVAAKTRLSLLASQYTTLASGIAELLTENDKKTFEINAGSVIGGMVLTVLNPFGNDYDNAVNVIEVIETLIDNYNSFVGEINGLQGINGGIDGEYVPDFEGLNGLKLSVNYAVSNLMDIAMGAKKERSYILPIDSNVILLAHRFYGSQQGVDNVEKFMNENGIELTEILQIKAGRTVLYYV